MCALRGPSGQHAGVPVNARRRASLGALALGLNLAACTIGSPEYRTFNAAPGRGAVQTSGLVCDSKTFAPDLASLQSCGGDKGHCYDRTKVPGVGTLPQDACPAEEICVPDTILVANGKKLTACESIIGAGTCVSTMVAEIDANKGSLGNQGCGADEACVPCVDPTNGNATTPFCLEEGIGVHEEPCVASTEAQEKPQACCLSKKGKPVGTCIEPSGVPEGQRGSVEQDLCKPGLACVPEALIRGEFTKCNAGYSGVCVDRCFVGMTNSSLLLEGGCDDGEVCVPCLFGKGQGLPGCQGEPDPG